MSGDSHRPASLCGWSAPQALDIGAERGNTARSAKCIPMLLWMKSGECAVSGVPRHPQAQRQLQSFSFFLLMVERAPERRA
jgi:hypothetical protein